MIIDKYLRQVVEESHHKGEITISMVNKAEKLREKDTPKLRDTISYYNNLLGRLNNSTGYQQYLAARSNQFGLYSGLMGEGALSGVFGSVCNKGYTYCPHCGRRL